MTSPGMAYMQMPMITKKLKAAEPTMVPGPRLSASNFSLMISITESRISGKPGSPEFRSYSYPSSNISVRLGQTNLI